jgi:hypothetical protein
MAATVASRSVPQRALEALRRSGNPFRNYFARNPDDEFCSRYHVSELFATEREQLLGVVDLYRNDPAMHSEMVPILGNKGAGKTHLLHSIKHGTSGAWQLLVTPGTYHKDTDFLEYLLFQIIDTLLGGSKQKGNRPVEFVGEALTRKLLQSALATLSPAEKLDLFPAPGLGRWARKLGLGSSQAQERTVWMLDQLARREIVAQDAAVPLNRLCHEAGIDPARACELVISQIERAEIRSTAGLMRRHIHCGFAKAALLNDEAELANFLTFGFAELDFKVKPTREDLVLALLKVLMEGFLELRIPVVMAFDQLEDLLLARRTDDGHRVAEAFFAGIVQAMHQIDGVCFLVFAERGLWNRFVPSLDGYIQDRLNNPVHVPGHGTIKTLRLEAPGPELVRKIVEARLRPSLDELPESAELPGIFPFTDEQIVRIARTEPTLRDMLQQFRHLFDHLVFGPVSGATSRGGDDEMFSSDSGRIGEKDGPATIKSVVVVETRPDNVKSQITNGRDSDASRASAVNKDSSVARPPRPAGGESQSLLEELWEHEIKEAQNQLGPQGAITGATRELQAGLGKFLQVCHEHGVKVGPWRLQHVLPEYAFGDHPTYGVATIAHWGCKDGQPWKVGIGLFLGRGPGKPKDLEIKLATMEVEPAIIDHLILLRQEEDLALSGKSKAMWQEAQKRGRHARLEPLSFANAVILYAFPRWLAAVTLAQAEGQPMPNLADFLQEHCEKLLEHVCMPIQQ